MRGSFSESNSRCAVSRDCRTRPSSLSRPSVLSVRGRQQGAPVLDASARPRPRPVSRAPDRSLRPPRLDMASERSSRQMALQKALFGAICISEPYIMSSDITDTNFRPARVRTPAILEGDVLVRNCSGYVVTSSEGASGPSTTDVAGCEVTVQFRRFAG